MTATTDLPVLPTPAAPTEPPMPVTTEPSGAAVAVKEEGTPAASIAATGAAAAGAVDSGAVPPVAVPGRDVTGGKRFRKPLRKRGGDDDSDDEGGSGGGGGVDVARIAELRADQLARVPPRGLDVATAAAARGPAAPLAAASAAAAGSSAGTAASSSSKSAFGSGFTAERTSVIASVDARMYVV